MKKIFIPDPRTVTATIDSKLSEFDFSYSDEIKSVIASEMDIDVSILDELKCAWFTNNKKIGSFEIINTPFSYQTKGILIPKSNLLLISVDNFKSQNDLGTIVHEVGHFLSLNKVSVVIGEACALVYEREWYIKNGKSEEFDEIYNNIETYGNSLKLLDIIKTNVFNDNEVAFENAIKKGNDNEFLNQVNIFLQAKGCFLSAKQLLFLTDIAFYVRNETSMSRAFKKNPTYFYRLFDELHQNVFPIIFNNNSTKEQIYNTSKVLANYTKISDLSLLLLDNIKDYQNYEDFEFAYKEKLAKEMHKIDIEEYFSDNKYIYNSFSEKIIINVFAKECNIIGITRDAISKMLNTTMLKEEKIKSEATSSSKSNK